MTDTNGSQKSVVIERTLDAPVALIWQMWTDPEHFKAWYGPAGATIPVANLDVRVGGRRHVGMEMQTPNGPMQMWFTGEHLEVLVNERLVYTESMSDEEGNVKSPSDMGMPEGHPETTEVIVQLEDLGGRTKNGDDPRRCTSRLARGNRLDDGLRQVGHSRRVSRYLARTVRWFGLEVPRGSQIVEPTRPSNDLGSTISE